jgi:hypothetical protein
MATDKAMRNRALVSVYHYGRTGKDKPLYGRPVLLTVLPLHQAVTILIEEPLEDEALHAIRLALGDLCRTRGAGNDSKVDREIERLATAFSQLRNKKKGHDHHAKVAQRFADIFSKEKPDQGIGEEKAYAEALRRMLAESKDSPPLESWEIKRK